VGGARACPRDPVLSTLLARVERGNRRRVLTPASAGPLGCPSRPPCSSLSITMFQLCPHAAARRSNLSLGFRLACNESRLHIVESSAGVLSFSSDCFKPSPCHPTHHPFITQVIPCTSIHTFWTALHGVSRADAVDTGKNTFDLLLGRTHTWASTLRVGLILWLRLVSFGALFMAVGVFSGSEHETGVGLHASPRLMCLCYRRSIPCCGRQDVIPAPPARP
jgi:hypothetical protein